MVYAFASTKHLLGFEPNGLPASPTLHGLRLRFDQVLLDRQAISLQVSPPVAPCSMTRCSSPLIDPLLLDPPAPGVVAPGIQLAPLLAPLSSSFWAQAHA
ncbi:hypothetical protein D9M69_700750 [compost metagenome]